MARITRFLSLRKQLILNRSNVRFATIQIPDPTKVIKSANENSANQNAGRAFPKNIDSFISWSNSSKLTKQEFGFLKAKKRRNKNRNNLEIDFYEAQPGADKDRLLTTTSLDKFGKIIEDFKPNNYSTLSSADRSKGTSSNDYFVGLEFKTSLACKFILFFNSILSFLKALNLESKRSTQVLNKIIYLNPKWDAATGIASDILPKIFSLELSTLQIHIIVYIHKISRCITSRPTLYIPKVSF